MGEGDKYIHDNRDENLGKPFLKCVVSIWALPVGWVGVTLARMVWTTFFPRPNGIFLFKGGQNAFQDDVCTFNLFWHCQKTEKELGSE